jgi:hypothetical protein
LVDLPNESKFNKNINLKKSLLNLNSATADTESSKKYLTYESKQK